MTPASSATTLIAAGLAALSGLLVAMQPVFNGRLAGLLHSPIKAAFVSFCAGAATLLAVLLITRASVPSSTEIARVPPLLWVAGGMMGAFFVAAAAWSAPRVGIGLYLAIMVACQLIAALTLDHLGAFGLAERAATGPRLAGVGLLIIGAWLVARG